VISQGIVRAEYTLGQCVGHTSPCDVLHTLEPSFLSIPALPTRHGAAFASEHNRTSGHFQPFPAYKKRFGFCLNSRLVGKPEATTVRCSPRQPLGT
jgi:hypothetical protein